MHFDFTDLKLFLLVLETGNITGGAARAHLSLASASARIRNLETALGTALLERNRRGVKATAAGKALGQHARLILQQAERLRSDLGEYALGFKGRIRLLCNTSALSEYLPEPLAAFLAEHPNIDLEVEEHPSLRILHALRQGTADLGIVSDAVDTSDLQTLPFRDDPLMVVMPKEHPLANHAPLRFAHMLDHDFVALGIASAMAIYLEEQALHSGKRLRIRVRAESYDGVMRMVAKGAGLGVVPRAAVRRHARARQLCAVPLEDDWAARRLLLCSGNFAALPLYVAALVDSLSSEA